MDDRGDYLKHTNQESMTRDSSQAQSDTIRSSHDERTSQPGMAVLASPNRSRHQASGPPSDPVFPRQTKTAGYTKNSEPLSAEEKSLLKSIDRKLENGERLSIDDAAFVGEETLSSTHSSQSSKSGAHDNVPSKGRRETKGWVWVSETDDEAEKSKPSDDGPSLRSGRSRRA